MGPSAAVSAVSTSTMSQRSSTTGPTECSTVEPSTQTRYPPDDRKLTPLVRRPLETKWQRGGPFTLASDSYDSCAAHEHVVERNGGVGVRCPSPCIEIDHVDGDSSGPAN